MLRCIIVFGYLCIGYVYAEDSVCFDIGSSCNQCNAGNCTSEPCLSLLSSLNGFEHSPCLSSTCLQLVQTCFRPSEQPLRDKRPNSLRGFLIFLLKIHPTVSKIGYFPLQPSTERFRRKGARLGSEFLGKRSDLSDENIDFLEKRSEFLGKRSEFLGKRSEFLGKRSKFLGKKSEFLGKRPSEFLGKRDSEFEDKRGTEFLGKREKPAKRGSEFLGKRSENEISDETGLYQEPSSTPEMTSSLNNLLLYLESVDQPNTVDDLKENQLQEIEKRKIHRSKPGSRTGREFLGKRLYGSEFLGKRTQQYPWIADDDLYEKTISNDDASQNVRPIRSVAQNGGLNRHSRGKYHKARRVGSEFLGKRTIKNFPNIGEPEYVDYVKLHSE